MVVSGSQCVGIAASEFVGLVIVPRRSSSFRFALLCASLTSSGAPEEAAASTSQHSGTPEGSSFSDFTQFEFHNTHNPINSHNPPINENLHHPLTQFTSHTSLPFHPALHSHTSHCPSPSPASLPSLRLPFLPPKRLTPPPNRRRSMAKRTGARLPPSDTPAPRGYHATRAVPERIHRGGSARRGRVQGRFSGRFVEWRKTGACRHGFAVSPPKRCE